MKRSQGRAIGLAKCLVVLAVAWDFHSVVPSAHGMLNFHTNNHVGFTRLKCLFESSSSSNQDSSPFDETRQLIEAQQRQIDRLMELLASKSTQSDGPNQQSASTGANISLSPLKVMLFVDGTWLYYALYTREAKVCAIQQKFGAGWQQKYSIDWGKLPRIIGHALQQQDRVRGWMPLSSSLDSDPPMRPVEVVRVSVYTSFRADTPKTSLRYQMFQDMIRAKYDVLMLETIGPNEKCVDIQLAVDMLHYSTVPDAYDVALLLSGDRDFVPAMVRCRQKGRRVGLVSVRGYCNRAFYETPNMKDYDVIWLDDYLDEIIQPNTMMLNTTTPNTKTTPNLRQNRPLPVLSEYTIMKVIGDFISALGPAHISSRMIGRYIKSIQIGDRSMLDEVKEIYGGLYQFLIVSQIFIVDHVSESKTFLVGVNQELLSKRLEEAKANAQLSEAEIHFFQSYTVPGLQSLTKYNEFPWQSVEADITREDSEAQEPPDYHGLTLLQLKEICRDKGLKVSGKKQELIERIQTHEQSSQSSSTSIEEDHATPLAYLEGLVLEYLQASGGKASSRDVGRYLTANKASPAVSKLLTTQTALSELKQYFGSLRQFVAQSDKFIQHDKEGGSHFEFLISLKSPMRNARNK